MAIGKVVLFLAVLIAVSNADTLVDDFWAAPGAEAVLTSTTSIDTVSDFACDPTAGGHDGYILGSCHVVSMRGISSSGCSSTASVGDGWFRCENGDACSGECTLQLDGPDTTALRTLSLDVDLLALGSGFRIFARSEIGSAFTIRVYSDQDEISYAVRNIPSGNTLTEFNFNFADDFAGSANFASVGAIEIEVPPENGKVVEFSDWQILSPFVDIRGQVLEDCGCDSRRTDFDVPVVGQTVVLTGDTLCRTTSLTTTTDAFGLYAFTGLLDCDYEISVPAALADDLCGYSDDAIPIQLRQRSVSRVDFAVDSGCLVPGSVSGTIYEDVACDGTRNEGEVGLTGVTVTLSGVGGCSSELQTTTTNPDGSYSFDTVVPCTYSVIIPSSTANLCPSSFTSLTVVVIAGGATTNADFRARAPAEETLDDLKATTAVAQLFDTLGVARLVSTSACDASNGGAAGYIVGGCHVVSVTGVGSSSCQPSASVQDDVFICSNPVHCGAKCRLLLDGLSVNDNIELGLEEDLASRGDAIRISAYSTQPVQITVSVYSSDGGRSRGSFTVPGFGDEATFDLNFLRNFAGDADFSDVGAIELEVANTPNVETVVTRVSLIDSVSADITGTVYQDCICDGVRDGLDDDPAPGVNVTLTGAVGCPVSTEVATTDELGRYLFQSLPPCTYVVSVDNDPVCEGQLSSRTFVVSRDSVFGVDFGLDIPSLECPIDVSVGCGFLQPAVSGEPKVCGVPAGYTFADDITCRDNLDLSITHITRTFEAAGLTCAQEINVLPRPLPSVDVDPFEVGAEVLRISSPDTITLHQVTESIGILGGVRELAFVGFGSATCEPLGGAVPQLAMTAIPPCAAALTARYDGNPSVGLDYDTLDLNLPELGDAFFIRTLADSARSITIRLYSSKSELSQVIVNTLANQETDFVIEWEQFNGNADLTTIKALEMHFSSDGSEVTQLVVTEWSIVSPLPTVTVSGRVFRDRNCNLVQDADETALERVRVRLASACGDVREVETDADGAYSFEDVIPCDALIASLVDPNIIVCDKDGNEAERILQTDGSNLSGVNFAVGCNFEEGQVCGDRCTPFGDPLPDLTVVEELSMCGTGSCLSSGGIVQCQGGKEVVVCPTDGMILTTSTCGRGRCRREGVRQCQAGVEVDNCELPRDGTIVDNCRAGEPCPGFGQILCIDGVETGSCRYEEYSLQTTHCGEGVCAGTGDLLCRENGRIADTCEPVADNEIVFTAQGIRRCNDGVPSNLLSPCELIDCSDSNECSADSCNVATSDCTHELNEFCDLRAAAAVLDSVFRDCQGVFDSVYSYSIRLYEEAAPDHVMFCMPQEIFYEATDIVNAATGEVLCSLNLDGSFGAADPATGISGLRFDCREGVDPRGIEYTFSVTALSSYVVNDATDDTVIATKTRGRNSFEYIRVIGPFDCDCTDSSIANTVDTSRTAAETDRTCTPYGNDRFCLSSAVLAVSVVANGRNTPFSIDEEELEVEVAALIGSSRYSVQVEEVDAVSNENGFAVVHIRFFSGAARPGSSLAAALTDLLVGRDSALADTLLEGAFVVNVSLPPPPPPDVRTFSVPIDSNSSGSMLAVNATLAMLLVALFSLFQ